MSPAATFSTAAAKTPNYTNASSSPARVVDVAQMTSETL